MALKQGSLQHTGTCRVCAIGPGAGTAAMYDPETNDERCPTCGDEPRPADPLGFLDLPSTDSSAGADASDRADDSDRADASDRADDSDRADGAGSGVAAGPRPSGANSVVDVTAAMPGSPADGGSESPLARELEAGLGDSARFLHHCKAPNTRGDIDHVIVAPSGVWIVDAKSYWGVVERRDVGNWRTVDHRLYVNGRDQTELVRNLVWQAAAVRAALDPVGLGDVPIHQVLLFIGSSGRWFSKPIEIDGVSAMWTTKLIEFAGQPGPLDDAARRTVAAQLSIALPATP